MSRRQVALAAAVVLATLAVGAQTMDAYGVPAAMTAARTPGPDHVVIIMLENMRYDAVIGDPKTPWISAPARAL